MAKILVDFGEKKALAELFKVSRVTIRAALSGITRTELADKIRATALQRGGKIQ